jgi:hypothetical protein
MRCHITILLLIFSGSLVSAQVLLAIPATSFKSEDKIQAKVINKSKTPVSYCVEFGQWSFIGDGIETTPVPFYMEKHNGSWHILINGPDIGSLRRPVTLDAGEAQDFPFRLKYPGEMRLTLDYWIGERDDVCNTNAKGKKTIKSQVFSIHN